jgi:hypothetical protein
MANIKEIAKDVGLTVALGPLGPTVLALKKALKKYKEAKTKKEKEKFQKMIDDLKSEIKLSKGDRGAAEAMPKKKADFNIFLGNLRKGKFKPASRTWTPPKQSAGPTGMTQQEMRRRTKGKFDMKKGGSVKTSKYSKGGGVRKSKYSL